MYNEELRATKLPENVYLLDVYGELIDENGWLKSEFKSDDIHLNHTYIPLLQQNLNTVTDCIL